MTRLHDIIAWVALDHRSISCTPISNYYGVCVCVCACMRACMCAPQCVHVHTIIDDIISASFILYMYMQRLRLHYMYVHKIYLHSYERCNFQPRIIA